ncbi:Glycosyl hydrolase family 66 [Acididesulfobacillus acetoxydans]|uniref:Dextranase n=2 Tax=Acididesulfobacillus acetoxydans TaxID=1561005 RepID=A0A8S0X777_9FIRM|nr:Glycosyl hydrolase family 66 [Acididesulfobacillus acetoxydans]CEJ05672.1 Dextranase [Acididesulfobacillus acetoxydans]
MYPAKSQFRPGERVHILLEAPDNCRGDTLVDIRVFHHHCLAEARTVSVKQMPAGAEGIDLGVFAPGGYRVVAHLESGSQSITLKSRSITLRSAFDVRAHWREAPRYGFLCDFQSAKSGGEIQRFFRKFHLNVVQFYDWMERHDALVPKTPEFTDPMGRRLSAEEILSRIEALREIGSAPLGYAAVYASLADYASAHPEEGLYDNQGVQYSLIDIFYLMDISEGSPWRNHILEEFARAIEFGFEGLHLDQYGYPKSARRSDGSALWLDDAYPSFIDACRRRLGDGVGLIFNAVSGYPVHSVGRSAQDAVYVEVWPPMVRYRHLSELVARIRAAVGGSKKVILAAYFQPLRETKDADPDAVARSTLLLSAVIFVSGGYHLLLGESGGILTEAYYPDYGPMVPALAEPLRAMYDILTADAELLSAADVIDVTWSFAGGINDQILVDGAPSAVEPEAGKIWLHVTTTPHGLVLHLVNLLWIMREEWNCLHTEPFRATPPLALTIEWNHPLEDVWVQRAEEAVWQKVKWSWQPHVRGRGIHLTVAPFDVWSMVFVPYQRRD